MTSTQIDAAPTSEPQPHSDYHYDYTNICSPNCHARRRAAISGLLAVLVLVTFPLIETHSSRLGWAIVIVAGAIIARMLVTSGNDHGRDRHT